MSTRGSDEGIPPDKYQMRLALREMIQALLGFLHVVPELQMTGAGLIEGLSQRTSKTRKALLRRSLPLRPLASLQPLSLANSRLEMRRNCRNILSCGDHSAPHLIAVRVDYEVVSIVANDP